ncbi:MAG: DUF5689 domain-containing protein [Bacteroidales bacterium]|nr:DUF5689 domain-containing protein [Bacteroidales bacterium]
MIKITKLLVILTSILFAGCFKQEIAPVLEYKEKANMTIAEFQKLHQLNTFFPATLIDTNVIITGIVTSTDKYGSSYKEIFFQDSTGGLSIRTSNSAYYNKYPIGQRIFVKAKGLYLGNYVSGNNTGFYQIGLYGNQNGGLEYLSASAENQHVFVSGVPEPCPAPKIFSKQSDIQVPEDYHTLVKIINCYFEAATGTIKYFEASGSSTTISRRIKFNVEGGNGIDARISAYCNFADSILPVGALNITGILTKFYDDTPQLMICSINDVEILPMMKILEEFDMKSNPFDAEWANIQKSGEEAWTYDPTNKNVRIQPQLNKETECWFVSPKFDFRNNKNVALFVSYRMTSATNENAQVLYTIDGGTTWKQFDFIPKQGNNDAVMKIDEIIVSNPNLQIAFKYKTTDIFPVWAITNICFKANVEM